MRSLRPWGTMTAVLIGTAGLCELAAVVIQRVLWFHTAMDPVHPVLDALPSALRAAAAYLPFVIAIVWCLWQYAAARNVRQRSASAQRRSPGYGVACWFIPILNLWRPYGVMRDLWSGSRRLLAPESQFPTSTFGAFVVRLWWALWVAPIVWPHARWLIGLVRPFKLLEDVGMVMALLSPVVGVTCAALAIWIVVRITAMQEAWPWVDPDSLVD